MDPGARNDAGPAMADADTERHTDSGRTRDADAYTGTPLRIQPRTTTQSPRPLTPTPSAIRIQARTRTQGPRPLTPTPRSVQIQARATMQDPRR